jgi:hypothetical protein
MPEPEQEHSKAQVKNELVADIPVNVNIEGVLPDSNQIHENSHNFSVN